MENNTGTMDRVIRIILGIVILAAGFYFESLWGLVAVIPLISGLVGFCPVYGVLGISTCPAPKVNVTK